MLKRLRPPNNEGRTMNDDTKTDNNRSLEWLMWTKVITKEWKISGD